MQQTMTEDTVDGGLVFTDAAAWNAHDALRRLGISDVNRSVASAWNWDAPGVVWLEVLP